MAEQQGSLVYQIARKKDDDDGEEKTTNVLVIITNNGATPGQTSQQIVVVDPDEDALANSQVHVEPDTEAESTVAVENADSPLYQDVSVQTTTIDVQDIGKYGRMTGTKKFKCLICGKELANGSILKRHIRIHTGVRPYQCSLCNKRFTQSNDLVAHMRSHTGSRPFKCEVCGKGFTQRQNVKKHMLTHTGEKNFECPVCAKRFGRKHHMEEHTRLHTNSEIRCKICEKGFTANGHLKRHLNKYHPDETLAEDIKMIVRQEQSIENEIPVVNFVTNQDTVETATVEVASIEPEVSSQIIFEPLQQNEENKETDVNEILYRCDLCEKQFKDLSFLERHLRLHLEGKLFNCTICQKVFNYKGLLKRHMVVHTKVKPFECYKCSKKFTQSNDLKIHMRLHTGIKPFKCEFCEMCFNQKQQLKNHRRKHTGERPFACDKCQKKFSRRDHLRAHLKTHNNDHLRCQICGYTSRNLKSWKKHTLKHENIEKLYEDNDTEIGEHPLTCRFCTKKFKEVRRLHKHEEMHEKSRLYNCNICNQTYFRFDTFEKHCKIHESGGDTSVVQEKAGQDSGEYVGTMIKIEMDQEDIEDESSQENTDKIIKNEQNTDSATETGDALENVTTDEVSENPEPEVATETGENVPDNQKNTLYCCSHCGKMLPWNADLVKHMETHLPDKPGERPTDVTKTGIVQTTNDGRYLCSICGRHFTNLIALQSHIKNIHNMDISDYELNYKESDGVMLTSDEIQKIEKQIQENLRFTGCYSVLKNASKRHLKTLSDKDKPIYQCEICAKVVKRKENLERHRKLHKIIHKCDVCNKTFKQKNHMETHRLIKHDPQGGTPIPDQLSIFPCDEPGCGKYFNKRFNLQRHQQLHFKGQNATKAVDQGQDEEDDGSFMVYECRRCNEMFRTIEELEKHAEDLHSISREKGGGQSQTEEERNAAEIDSIVSAASEAISKGTENGVAVKTNNSKVHGVIDNCMYTAHDINSSTNDIILETSDQAIPETSADYAMPETSEQAMPEGQEVIEISDHVIHGGEEVIENSDNVANLVHHVTESSDHVLYMDQHEQEITEIGSREIMVTNGDNPNQVIIQLPQDGSMLENQNVIQCQILNSETGNLETVFIPVTQSSSDDIPTETTISDSVVAIETLDSTDSDNTAAVAMMALSAEGSQYIENEHDYVHSG